MGDRGGTATLQSFQLCIDIIPDGRSGGNRNSRTRCALVVCIIPDGRSGGNRNSSATFEAATAIIPDGRSGGNRNTYDRT